MFTWGFLIISLGYATILVLVYRGLLSAWEDNALMKFFAYGHLPEHLQKISKPFGELAKVLCEEMGNNAEGVTALRKLLESKDCAVRSLLD